MIPRIVFGLPGPALADRWQVRRLLLAAMGLLCAAIFAAHFRIGSQALLLAGTLLSLGLLSAMLPIGEALGVAAARSDGFPYSHARAIGSAGFLAASLTVGVLIGPFGVNTILWWVIAALLVTAYLGFTHPGGGKVRATNPPGWFEIRRLFANPVFLIFALSTATIQASHAVLNVYGTIHWKSLGFAESTIGVLWSAGLIAEISVMILAGPTLLRRLGPIGAIILSGTGTILRWSLMLTDPVGPTLWLAQAMHALTFAAGHPGMMKFIEIAIPDRFGATAQGMTAGPAGGVMMGIAMGLAALLYPALAGWSFALGVVFAAVGTAGMVLVPRLWRGGEIAL